MHTDQRLPLPQSEVVNGYRVELGDDRRWRVFNSDGRLAGPYTDKADAIAAAESLPPKGFRP